MAELSSSFEAAFPNGADIRDCCHALHRDRLKSKPWQDEVTILIELFGRGSVETWRLPARCRRALNRAEHRGGVEPPAMEYANLVKRLDWVEHEVSDSLRVSRRRLRKKRLKRASRTVDGLLVLVRNGSEPDPEIFSFSYSLMVGYIQ